MTDLRIRTAAPDEAEAVLAFWKEAAEGTSITDDVDGVTRLIDRDPMRSSSPSGTACSWAP
jgi:hypothetical protein